jgi:hypothetical protein
MEEIIRDGIVNFEARWGLRPNGILMHPWTFLELRKDTTQYPGDDMDFVEGIAIYRSPDMKDNEIKFVL